MREHCSVRIPTSLPGQADPEDAAAPRLAFHADVSTVSLRCQAAESKAEPAAGPADAGVLDLIEGFKDPLPLLRRDAGALVGHGEPYHGPSQLTATTTLPRSGLNRMAFAISYQHAACQIGIGVEGDVVHLANDRHATVPSKFAHLPGTPPLPALAPAALPGPAASGLPSILWTSRSSLIIRSSRSDPRIAPSIRSRFSSGSGIISAVRRPLSTLVSGDPHVIDQHAREALLRRLRLTELPVEALDVAVVL